MNSESVKKSISWLLVMVMVMTMTAFVNVLNPVNVYAAPSWDKATIDQTVAETLVKFTVNQPSSTGSWSDNVLQRAPAMYTLALMSYYNSNLTSTGGVKVGDRLLQHIRSIIAGGNEPACRGAISGWVDNQAALALALAKNTPYVWNALTTTEKDKCDFIMECLAIAGNYCHNYSNDPYRDLAQVYSWKKKWNPNHVEGYVGVMVGAYLYFGGATNVNNIFSGFSHSSYNSQCDTYGFTNIKDTFNKAGATLMEQGGTDAGGGTVQGVKIPFTYKDIESGAQISYDPFLLYKSLGMRMFKWTNGSTHPKGYISGSSVYSTGGTLRAYITDSTQSPYKDGVGIAYEFLTDDAYGVRSSLSYVWDGLRNNIITRATIYALGYWGSGSDRDTLASRMDVGMEDFLYKCAHGYTGYKNGATESSVTYSGYGGGFEYLRQVWYKVVKNGAGGTQLTLFSDSFNGSISSTWTTNNGVNTSSVSYEGGNSAKFNSSDYLTKAISTSGYTNIQLSYYRKAAPSGAGDFVVEWYNGSTWTQLESVSGTSDWTQKTWTLPSGANNNTNFQFKFRVSGCDSYDNFYLDVVELKGTN